MFEQLTAPDHVIAMRFSGMLTLDDVKKYQDFLGEKLGTHEHINACIDLTGMSDIKADALIDGIKADMQWISHINQIGRLALVSEKEWPRAAVQIVAPLLLPTLEMKVFQPDQRTEALEWAAQHADGPKHKTSAFRFLPTNKEDVLAFEINGAIVSEEMPEVIKKMETFLAAHEKVRVLNRMQHFGGIDLSVFMQGGLVSMKLAAMEKVERYAIVGAPGWMAKIVETVNPVFPDFEMRIFAKNQEKEAWSWIGASLTD